MKKLMLVVAYNIKIGDVHISLNFSITFSRFSFWLQLCVLNTIQTVDWVWIWVSAKFSDGRYVRRTW